MQDMITLPSPGLGGENRQAPVTARQSEMVMQQV